MANIPRQLVSGEKEVENFLNNASMAGLRVIELLWRKRCLSVKTVVGWEIPIFRIAPDGRVGVDVDNAIDVIFVEGQIQFYPDTASMCWGYVIDTPGNRMKIIDALKTGWFKIQDKEIERELLKEAIDKGISTEIKKQEIIEVKGRQEQLMKDKLSKANEEIEKLKRELAKKEVEAKPLADALGISTVKKVG